jgi:hypothetical protein
MTTTINASTSTGLVQTADTSGIIKVQSNGTTTNALAWVNFVGNSSPYTINSSYNVSSVTRNGTGDFTITYTNALTSQYCTPCFIGGENSAGSGSRLGSIAGLATGTLRVQYRDGGNSVVDPVIGGVAVFA